MIYLYPTFNDGNELIPEEFAKLVDLLNTLEQITPSIPNETLASIIHIN